MNNRNIVQQGTVNPKSDSVSITSVNALKSKFITDMELASLARMSRKGYKANLVMSSLFSIRTGMKK